MRTAIIAIIVLIVIAGGAYLYWQDSDKGNAPNAENQAVTPNTNENSATGNQEPGNTPAVSGNVEVEIGGSVSPVKEFTVEGKNLSFSPTTLTAKKGDTVRITFKNVGGFHDFVIDELGVKTKQIQAGAQESVEFVASKAGSFEYYCSVGSHRQMGMKGTLVVTE